MVCILPEIYHKEVVVYITYRQGVVLNFKVGPSGKPHLKSH